MEGFIINLGWDPRSFPGGAGCTYETQPTRDRRARSGFPHRAGFYQPEDIHFRPRDVGVVQLRKDCHPGMESYRPQVTLALCTTPSQSAISQWGWGFHNVRGGVDLGELIFVPGLSEL